MKTCFMPTAALLAAALVTACASTPPKQPPDLSWDGLELRTGTRLDRVYVRKDATFDRYKKVVLDPLEVSFDRNWNPKEATSGASALQPDAIRADLSRVFADVFKHVLETGGEYAIVDKNAGDVLRVRASITNLYIAAPAADNHSGKYVLDAGHMTLVAHLQDAESGLLLARVFDDEVGPQTGEMEIAGGLANSAEARQAISKWATALRDALHRAQAAPVE